MKKIVLILGVLIFMAACGEKQADDYAAKKDEDLVEIPAGIEAEVLSFNLKESTEQADLIAEITIVKKVEEVKEKPVPYTVFNAVVKEVIKGDPITEEILIKQQGDSEWTFNNNKLFEEGEAYILFLKAITVSKGDYWIIGEETGMFHVLDAENVVKLAEPIEELRGVEILNPKGLNTLDLLEGERDRSNMQVISKVGFIKKINAVGEKN